MRQILYLLIGFASFGEAPDVFSQSGETYIYGGPTIAIGLPAPAYGAHMTYIHTSGWGINVASQVSSFKADDYPADYYGGFEIFSSDVEHEHFISLSPHLIREFVSGDWGGFGLQVGPSLILTKDLTYFPVENPEWFSSNYNVYSDSGFALGLSARANVRLSFSRWAALEVAGICNFNHPQPFWGAEVSLGFGKVR